MINIEEIEFELMNWYDDIEIKEHKVYYNFNHGNMELVYYTDLNTYSHLIWIFLDKLCYYIETSHPTISLVKGKQFEIIFNEDNELIDLTYYFSDVVKHGVMYHD